MASTTNILWADRIDFAVQQSTLAIETGDFAYFHASKAHYIANDVDYAAEIGTEVLDPKVKASLSQSLTKGAEYANTVVASVDKNLEATKINDKLSQADKEKFWNDRIDEENLKAQKDLIAHMNAAAEEAKRVIAAVPTENLRKVATDLYLAAFNLVHDAVNYAISQLKQIYTMVKSFLQKIFAPLINLVHVVGSFVGGVVSKVRGFFGLSTESALAQTYGLVGIGDSEASQAGGGRSLLSLNYSFRVPDDEIVDSTNRIWENYLATSEQEPHNVSLSREPRPEGERDTDGKLMFISWEAPTDDGGSNNNRELIEPIILSEQKSLAGSYTGGLRYNVVDLAKPPKQQQLSRGRQSKVELRSKRY